MDEDQVRQSSDAPGDTVADTMRHPGAARTPRAHGPEAAYDYSGGIRREAGLHRTTRARAVDQRTAFATPVAGARVPTKSVPIMDRQERERNARDLYDRIIQDIYAGTLELETLALDLPDRALAAQLERLSRHFTTVISDLHAHGCGASSLLWSAGYAAVHGTDGDGACSCSGR